jgi:formylglycine-generating enzyme required for sulfatase activity
MPLTIGQVLHNRYRIDALLGQGGMGAVYRATDLTFSAQVALKENLDTSPPAQKQFAHEAGILYHLRHPNLPRVGDYFFVPGQGQYLVMDYVAGEDLSQILARGPVAEGQALAWVGQALDALEYLHSQSPPVVHRDVKPANVKVTPQGRVMLVDFGLAKMGDPSQLTASGARAVTPGYAPLEQYGMGHTDARTDLYALGATLYTALTGQVPPPAPDLAAGSARLVPPRQLTPRVSAQAEAAVLRALALQPGNRFQTAAEFRAALAPQPAPAPVPAAAVAPKAYPLPVTSQAYGPPPPGVYGVPAPRHGSLQAGRLWWMWAGGALLALALIVGGWRLFAGRPDLTPTPMRWPPTTTPTVLPANTPAPIAGTWARPADGMVMVAVPAGEFTMGSPAGQGSEDEHPQHQVTLDGYWIDRTEVTNAQYRRCVEAGACAQAGCMGDSSYNADAQPVVCVSWEDAAAYCGWAGARLPTEAEWEKAARGTEGRTYPWGDEAPDCGRANYSGCEGRPSGVGSHPGGASPYGVLDMAGNVWEWVSDWYDGSYYGRSPAGNPQGPESGQYRVLRGGSCYNVSDFVRSAYRGGYIPGDRCDVGFRCGVSSTSSP